MLEVDSTGSGQGAVGLVGLFVVVPRQSPHLVGVIPAIDCALLTHRRVVRPCVAATADPTALITSIAESAPKPIRAALAAITPAPIATTASATFHPTVKYSSHKARWCKATRAFRRDGGHDHQGYGHWCLDELDRWVRLGWEHMRGIFTRYTDRRED